MGQTLIGCLNLVQAWRIADPMGTVAELALFLAVALGDTEKNYIRVSDIEKLINAPRSVTRLHQRLGTGIRNGVKTYPGLQFVVSAEDPDDSRRKVLKLTPKGRQMYHTLCTAAGDA